MLEMTEAAAIVHGATEQSLVLMDEIGRGTSTFDGLALAGAIASHLHERNRAFTLFATHYFELTAFPSKHDARAQRARRARPRAAATTSCSCTRSQPGPGQPQLRRAGGAAGRHAGRRWCARRARRWRRWRRSSAPAQAQIDLFAAPPRAGRRRDARAAAALERRARARIDPDTLTPREALDALTASSPCSKDTP